MDLPLPGLAIAHFFAAVAMVVAPLLGGGWLLSLVCKRHAPFRHTLLVSALGTSLASPFFILVYLLLGPSLVAVPTAADPSDRTETNPPFLPWTRALAPDRTGRDDGHPSAVTSIDHKADSAGGDIESEVPQTIVPDPGPTFRLGSIVPAVRPLIPIWMAGTVLLFGRLLLATWRLRLRMRSLRTVRSAMVLEAMAEAKGLSRANGSPRLASSALAAAPAVAGIFQPTIVLPNCLIGALSREQWIDLFLHEIAHVERRDNAVALLQAVSTALYWPIPFTHLVNAQLEQAREDICDNHVLTCRDAPGYGETLFRVAQLAGNTPKLHGAIGIFHWRGKLETRIFRLLQQGRIKMTRIHPFLAAVVLALFSLASMALCASAPLGALLDAQAESAFAPASEPLAETSQEPMPKSSSVPTGQDNPPQTVVRPLKASPLDEPVHLDAEAVKRAAIGAIQAKKGRLVLDETGQPKQLDWDNDQVTDRDLRWLRPFTKLESLNLSRTRVTNKGLEELKVLTELTDLHLYDTAVSDAGLNSLKGLTKLKFLMVKRTDVSDAGAREFARSLPACLISHSPRNPWPAEIGADAGHWTVEFVNGVKEDCKIHPKEATASVVEPKRSSVAKVARVGGALVFVYEDNRVERWTAVGKRYIVEHWVIQPDAQAGANLSWRGYPPLRPLPTGTPVLGIAERVHSAQVGLGQSEPILSWWVGLLR